MFAASETEFKCQWILNEVWQQAGQYTAKFAVDSGVIEWEYLKWYKYWLEKHPDDAITYLLKQILEDSDYRFVLSATLDPEQSQLLNELRCIEPVEPELLGMIANAKRKLSLSDGKDFIRLLLVGPGVAHREVRSRQVNDAAIRNRLKDQWPWLDVRFAIDVQIHPSIFELENKHRKDKEFELKVAFFLQGQRPHLRCQDSPIPKKLDGKDIGDFDVFGYEDNDPKLLVVLVGECKLRQEGKEGKRLVTREEILKLDTRASIAKKHETILSKAKGRTIQVEVIFVSNAIGFEENAKKLAQDLDIRYLKANLTKNWERDDHWKIKSLTPVD